MKTQENISSYPAQKHVDMLYKEVVLSEHIFTQVHFRAVSCNRHLSAIKFKRELILSVA